MGVLDRFSRPPTQDEFAARVMKMLRDIGDQRSAAYDKAEFRLLLAKDGEPDGMINLTSLYAEYCQEPRKARATWLRSTCLGLAQRFELPTDFEDVKPDLLPSIRSKALLEVLRLDIELEGGPPNEALSVPLSEQLAVCLVYDLPTTMRFVTSEMLGEWGVTLFEAIEVAKHNLAQREFTVGAIDERMYVFVTGDAYDAARMLLLDRIRSMKVSGQPVVLPINRDSLLLAGSDDPNALGMMADLAEKKENEPRPICSIPHKLVGDEWEAWLPPPDHPHHERFRMLQLKNSYREYADQKKLLDKLHERDGDDIFVASFSAVERDDKVLSYCVWSKNVLSWLPKTEFVALYDHETEQSRIVSWARLESVAGHLMTPLDYFPPRWSVSEFPSEDLLEQMGGEDWSPKES